MNYNNILSVLLENTSKSQKYILIKNKNYYTTSLGINLQIMHLHQSVCMSG